MPVAFEGPPNELAGLNMFLEEQRAAVLRKLDGLSDAQAIEHPTASEFCMLTLVKHLAYVERRWFQLEVARRDVPGLWPPPDDSELELEPGDTIESIRRLYEEIIDEDRDILSAVTDLDSLLHYRPEPQVGAAPSDRGDSGARGSCRPDPRIDRRQQGPLVTPPCPGRVTRRD